MRDLTRLLWNEHNLHPSDRERLVGAVGGEMGAARVLYPGSYIDIAASFVFDDVTYVDSDKRATRFIDDTDGVAMASIDDLYRLVGVVNSRSGRYTASDRILTPI